MMSTHRIKLKRVYEPVSADDGTRVLVERLWPRGLSKADAAIDLWAKDIAPSPALRKWYGHRAERWQEFRARYRAELRVNSAVPEMLRELRAGTPVTFVFAARDILRSGAVALKDYLDAELGPDTGSGDPEAVD
jgi:uncharacterized protein YeaO (DUF488 family)